MGLAVGLGASMAVVACGTSVVIVDATGTGGARVGSGPGGGTTSSSAAGGSTTCENVASNPLHCGYCGHSCLGGECVAGVCQPVVLADLEASEPASALAIDDTHVYWADGIRRVGKQGGQVQLVAEAGVGDHWGVAVDDTFVYWVSVFEPAVYRAPKQGGPPTLLAPAEGYRVAVDDTWVYFNWNGLWRTPIQGGGLENLWPDGGTGVVLDDTRVYWTDWNTGAVWQMDKLSLVASPLAVGVGADYMAEHGDYVYWAAPSNLGIQRVSKQGGTVDTLATQVGAEMGVAVDDDGVYWPDFSGGRILMLSQQGGSPVELATGQHGPRDIAADADAVYWTNDAIYSKIMKVAKP